MASPPRLTIPPPARVAIAQITVAGVPVLIHLDPEWARYLDALAVRLQDLQSTVTTIQNGQGGGASFSFGDTTSSGDDEFTPGVPGPIGLTGAVGPAGPMLLPADPEPPDFFLVPGSTGPTGATGPAGQMLIPAEPEAPDFFVVPGVQGIAGNDGATGPTGPQGAPGPWIPMEPEVPDYFPGPAGPQGSQGAQGVQGNAGADGAMGFAVGMLVDGTGEPLDYVPMAGPQGATGATGSTGNTGAQGSVGAALFTLIPDAEPSEPMPVPGPQGPTGSTGAQGSVGQALWTLSEQGEAPEQIMGPQLSGSQVLVTPLLVSPFVRGLLDASDATAGQIKFPATQNASSNANTLDDYEEGTWTPTITFATPGNLSVTYLSNIADYTKVGRLVHVNFQIVTSAFTFTTASGDFEILGFPFANAQGYPAVGALWWAGITKASYTNVVAFIDSAVSIAKLKASGSGIGDSTVGAADMPTGGTIVLRGSLSYVA